MMFETFPAGYCFGRRLDAADVHIQGGGGADQDQPAPAAVVGRAGASWFRRGTGHKRIYSLDDLAEVAILCDLRERGFSLQKIRSVIRFLQKELGKRLVETVAAASEYHLLTDGRTFIWKTPPGGWSTC